ncbi:MAG: NADH-quinone oxidoreductase subunit D [Chloroflexi bacterium]|nr:NADH-quinone oxidoreductase subunit D [Chloroflexota bacterium]MDA1239958.1 NADH-quinone oxidoreductase subunit D [Chloroflexota bacterium]MQC25429.1 NADH-quinone oxidoreductase subunit D [Chloroflexota bacterium]MQC48215.1 NADH-quinone oxidoreductase subunit D [Chloroflexota bacterium]
MPASTEPYVLNIGPQHPSTHGVFRLRVVMDGEVIRDLDMIVGYLHRSMEKLAEERTYTQNIPFTDRADYLAAMSSNLGLALAAERLSGVVPTERSQYLRVIFAELQRIASHAMANGTLISDAGAWQTPLLYMFREREKILDLFEMTCGARLTTNYMRIGGVAFEPPPEFWPALQELVDELPERIDEYFELLTDNEIFLGRTRNVGVISAADAINGSLTGPALRGSGVPWDLRKAEPYCVYDRFNFDIPVGTNGDVYDRFMVRMEETKQSVAIIRQAMEQIPAGPHKNDIPLALRPEIGEIYSRVESPRGEIGFYLVSDGTPAPYRFHLRAPSMINLSLLRELGVGASLPDAVVTLGSLDIVVGEIDR